MKRVVSIILVMLILIPAAGLATGTIDLSSLSVEELVALKDKIDLAIWNSKDWQEVTVPQGVYQVGVDIPAGHWTIKAADGADAFVTWGTQLDETKKGIDSWNSKFYQGERLVSKTYDYFNEKEDISEIDFVLEDAQYIIVEDGIVIFSPYAGKPGLGFK